MYCSFKKVYSKIELFTAMFLDEEGFCDMTPGLLTKGDQLTICQSTRRPGPKIIAPRKNPLKYTKNKTRCKIELSE